MRMVFLRVIALFAMREQVECHPVRSLDRSLTSPRLKQPGNEKVRAEGLSQTNIDCGAKRSQLP